MTRDITDWLEAHRVDPDGLAADVVVGIGHALRELRSLAGRLRHPEAVAAAGGDVPRGVLLHGRPGMGKTTAARWLAREVGADVPVYEVAADELTAPRVRALFRALAGTRAFVLVDELDALGRRASLLDPATRAAQAALLRALDGLADLSGPVVVACTTAWPDSLEPALVRHGRLGIHVRIAEPSDAERRALIASMAARRGVEGPLDLDGLAAETDGWSPAAVRQAFDDALGLALLDGRARPSAADLDRAVGRDGEVGPERGEAPRGDRRRLAVHEAGHVAVGVALFGLGAVTSAELLPGGGATELGALGPLAALPDPGLLDAVAVHYGGVAAERLLLGAAAASARDDVRRATRLLLSRVDSGVEEGVPPLALGELDRPSERALAQRDASLARRADAAMAVAEAAVDAARAAVLAFAAALEVAGSLRGPALAGAIRDAGFPSAGDGDRAPAQLAEAA